MTLKLPRFTFLCGPKGLHQKELSITLCEQDEALQFLDFEEPLRCATMELFFGGFQNNRDLTKDEERRADLPNIPQMPVTRNVAWFLTFLEERLRSHISDDILARIAYARWKEDGGATIFDRFIYRDCSNVHDVDYIANLEGPTNCQIIHLGPMESWQTAVPQLWLPMPSLSERMAMLKRELGEV